MARPLRLVALLCLGAVACGSEGLGVSAGEDGVAGEGGSVGNDENAGEGGAAGAPMTDEDTRELAAMLLLEGEATGTSGEWTAECLLSWVVELRGETVRADGVLEYAAVAGGEVVRSVLDPTGAGFEFHADAFGEAIVRWTLPDRFEFLVPINETAEGRFWRNLAYLEGSIDADGKLAMGEWECGPLDIDQGGYVDTDVVAPGGWTIVPIEPTPSDPCETNNGDCDPQTTCENEDGVAVCGPCPEGLAGNGTIGCFECHMDADCPSGESCVANECAAAESGG